MEKDQRKPASLGDILLMIGALLCFVLALYFAWYDRVTAGTLMAALFVALLLLRLLPQMESFKAFGLEAKMRATLTEADDLLKKLRAAAAVSGRSTFHTLSWGSRWSNPMRLKQALADDYEKTLVDIGVPQKEIDEMKSEWLRFGLRDLYNALVEVALQRRHVVVGQLHRAANLALQAGKVDQAEQQKERIKRIEKWMPPEPRLMLSLADFREHCSRAFPIGMELDQEFQALRELIKRMESLGERSMHEGRIIEDAQAVLEINDPRKELYNQTFGSA
jgi:hypothetical protein